MKDAMPNKNPPSDLVYKQKNIENLVSKISQYKKQRKELA
mgnify:CR=1 FL=1|jgi:hypothetical protein